MANYLYTSVAKEAGEDIESLTSNSEQIEELITAECCCRHHHYRLWQRHGIYHVLSSLIIATLGLLYFRAINMSDEQCLFQTRSKSSANEALRGTSMREVTFDGSLWYDSPYKGPPTEDNMAAWMSLMEYGFFATTEEAIRVQGRNTTVSSQFEPALGGGYMSLPMGSHQLHCLKEIWRDHHSDYFEDIQANMRDIPELYERHYQHCVDIIRQSLMCNFDTSLMTFAWVLDHHNPVPDANAPHKCIDWDSVQTWLKERAVTVPDDYVYHQPENAVTLDWNP